MSLNEAENARYHALAEYDQVVLPQYLRLKNVDWQLVRGLILKHWQQQNARFREFYFKRQQPPPYLSCRHLLTKFNPNSHGGYPSRLIYLPHDFLPEPYYCPLALDRTRRALPATIRHTRRNAEALTEAENYYRYNNLFTSSFRDANQRNGWQSPPTWGREDIEAAWLRQVPDARAFMAAHLNYVAWHLSTDRTLAILLEPGAPRLGELHDEKYVLGYVGYFFDCWNKFHEYEQVLPATMEPAATGNLGLRQVALLHIYEGKPAIKRDERANELARQHGHASGAKLYDHYRKLSKHTGITGVEGAEVPKLIIDIEAVLPSLSGAPEQAARAHLQTLKTK